MAELDVRSSFSSGNDADPSEGTGEIIINLCKGVIAKSVGHMTCSADSDSSCFHIHRHQCDFLVKVLSETQVTLTHIHHDHAPGRLGENMILVLRHLHQALVAAERLLATSCNLPTVTDWLKAAIARGDMKETLSKLIYDVKWHMDVLNGILVELQADASYSCKFELSSCTGRLSPGDERWLLEAKRKDEKVFQERSQNLDHPLADQLTNKFLNPEILFNNYSPGISLGKGAFAEVREITLFASKYAIKTFKTSHTSFKQEVAALLALGHHPNIVHLLWYSEKSSECYLIMEKMEMDLTSFLAHFQKMVKRAMSGVEAVCLMLEIAEGVRFIHSKGMAHRDLKPANVLVNFEADKVSIRSVKIADFGLSKTKDVSRTYGGQTLNVGTTRYMPPEVIKGADDPEKGEFNSRKADVYSFAIMCAEVLIGDIAYHESLPKGKMKSQVKAGVLRPDLPHESCPKQLAGLISRCWDGDFRQRPDFDAICQELRFIKGLILRGDLQTEDGMKHGLNVEGAEQESGMTSSHATVLKSWFVSFFKLVPRRLWTNSKRPHFLMVLFLVLLLLLSITLAMQHNYQVPRTGGKKGDEFSIVTRAIKAGPWGREEPYKTKGLFDDKHYSIKAIYFRYDKNPPGIGLMAVRYANHDGEEFTRPYGGPGIGQITKRIAFEPGEYIKQLSGCVGKYVVSVPEGKVGLPSVVSVTIHSNLRSYGPYGDEVGHRFRSGTGKVIGFFGAAGVLLDKLGVWIIPDGQDNGDESFILRDSP